jgi:hypothetical protein
LLLHFCFTRFMHQMNFDDFLRIYKINSWLYLYFISIFLNSEIWYFLKKIGSLLPICTQSSLFDFSVHRTYISPTCLIVCTHVTIWVNILHASVNVIVFVSRKLDYICTLSSSYTGPHLFPW